MILLFVIIILFKLIYHVFYVKPKKNTIFVSVASYRDTQLNQTLLNLFENATNYKLVYVCVCQQNHPEFPKEFVDLIKLHKYKSQIKMNNQEVYYF